MSQLIVNIDDALLEQRLFQCAEKEKKDISTLVKEALIQFLVHRTGSGLDYRKQDPALHLNRFNYQGITSSDDSTESNPFSEVTDAQEYALRLRDKAWK